MTNKENSPDHRTSPKSAMTNKESSSERRTSPNSKILERCSSLGRLLWWMIALACSLWLVVMIKESVWTFLAHPTATSVRNLAQKFIEFPAVSICDRHYDLKEAMDAMDFPQNPFKPIAAGTAVANTDRLYRMISDTF